jgi:hypothetical protein
MAEDLESGGPVELIPIEPARARLGAGVFVLRARAEDGAWLLMLEESGLGHAALEGCENDHCSSPLSAERLGASAP